MILSIVFSICRALITLTCVAAQDTSLAEVKLAFDNANIPANAHLTFNPTVLFEVTFPQSSGSSVHLKAGMQLKRNQTAIPPTFEVQSVPTSELRDTFVVAMVDLDAPTPQAPTNAQIRHFLGGNFKIESPVTHAPTLLANSTPAISEFRQPTPPAGSDPHRYVFLLFKQPAMFNQQTIVNASTPIQNFNISQFAIDVGLGSPLGGSFMLVGPDPST